MAVTLRNYLDAKKWHFAEKGMQRVWDELKRIANSTVNLNAVLETNNIDTTGAGGLTAVAGESNSGAFTVVPPDPAGRYGAVPQRSANRIPTNGFLPNAD